MNRVIDGEVAREIPAEAFGTRLSETAANIANRLYPKSGVMRYRVVVMNGAAQAVTHVEAATGDEAAEMALAKYPGQKVAYVGPATGADAIPAIDVVDGE